jgi:hypothetical protein
MGKNRKGGTRGKEEEEAKKLRTRTEERPAAPSPGPPPPEKEGRNQELIDDPFLPSKRQTHEADFLRRQREREAERQRLTAERNRREPGARRHQNY